MVQDYVESLAEIGEWQVFIVGGRIEAIVHTYKVKGTNNWNWKLVQCYLTLEEIRYAFQNVRRDELSEPF